MVQSRPHGLGELGIQHLPIINGLTIKAGYMIYAIEKVISVSIGIFSMGCIPENFQGGNVKMNQTRKMQR